MPGYDLTVMNFHPSPLVALLIVAAAVIIFLVATRKD